MGNEMGRLRSHAVMVAELIRTSYERDLGKVGAFLPECVPLNELPTAFAPYLAACAELPVRYPAGRGGVRKWLERGFRRDDAAVRRAITRLTEAERDTLMTALSVLGHTYRWDSVPPAPARFEERCVSLPPGIAGPWGVLAKSGRHPRVGTTWSLHLCNWTMTNRCGGAPYLTDDLSGDNVRVAHNWLGPPFDRHLDRFSISFVLMEARGARVLRHLVESIEASASSRIEDALVSLELLHGAIRAMTVAFSSSVRRATVDPAIWLELVQPTFAWSAEADEPGRVEGGPSGIQLGTIQALDAALGIAGTSGLATLAKAGRRYMPRPHRRFLGTLDEAGPIVRTFILHAACKELREQFNMCVKAMRSFRTTHQARGAQYLRNRQTGDAARASTGLMIGVDDDPVATFERAMTERTAETEVAILAPVACPQPAGKSKIAQERRQYFR